VDFTNTIGFETAVCKAETAASTEMRLDGGILNRLASAGSAIPAPHSNMDAYFLSSLLNPLSATEIPDILPPYEDGVFKTLLTHPRATPILKDVLSIFLELDIETVIVRNVEPPISYIDEKRERFDVNCEFNGGSQAEVEMQAKAMAGDTMKNKHKDIKSRAIYNINDLHSSQDGMGVNFSKLKRTFQITICGYTIFHDKKKFINQFSWRDPEGYLLGDDETIVFVELSKLGEAMEKPVEMMSGKEKWSIFFAYGADPSKKELIGKLADSKEEIRMAINLLAEISKDENERLRYRARRKFEMDLASQIIAVTSESWSEGKAEGILEGKAEGILEGKAEGILEGEAKCMLKEKEAIAKKLISLGFDNSIIEQSTGFSTDEINVIRSMPSPQMPMGNPNSSPDE
jgi:predicted transposase/invertase (TIGR01784 family)